MVRRSLVVSYVPIVYGKTLFYQIICLKYFVQAGQLSNVTIILLYLKVSEWSYIKLIKHNKYLKTELKINTLSNPVSLQKKGDSK